VGRYTEGRSAALSELREAHDYRLDFVVPHACLNQAAAETGLRKFATSRALIQRALQAANRADRFIPLHAASIELRLALAGGESSRAAAVLRRAVKQSTPGIEGEFLAARALALACAGDIRAPVAHCEQATELTARPEAGVTVACTEAIISLAE